MKLLARSGWFAAPFIIAAGSLCVPSVAAPFCLQSQALPAICIYYDSQQCEKEALRLGGACSANPAELHLTRGVGQFCVVTSSKVSLCAYADRQACSLAAARQQGTCIAASNVAPARTPDPYSPIDGQ